MEVRHTYKAIVIGTGQGGAPLASALAAAGWNTAVIEQAYVGGSCINYGCTPTKALVASAKTAYTAAHSGEYGIEIHNLAVKWERVRQRRDEMVESFRSGSRKRLEQQENLDLIFGKARFAGRKTIEVTTENDSFRLKGETIIINTGAKAVIPPIKGLEQTDHLDSTTIQRLDNLPDHLLILGGGYIGLEFGQMFHRFGSKVTLIQRGKQLLPREDEDIAEAVYNILSEEGLSVHLNSEAFRAEKLENGSIRLHLETPEGRQRVEGSHLLIAVGRKPATADLNLAATGVETDKKGYVQVDDHLQTGIPGIYAIGDVKPGPAFTHISYDDFRVVRDQLLGNGRNSMRNRLVPYTVFMDPQLGRVGLSEKEAKQQNISYKVARLSMDSVARAIETGHTRGFMKALVSSDSGKILGCAILGSEGGETMAVLQTAMMGELHYSQIRDAVYAHPTYAESLNNLFMKIED
ncbi:MAG: mercuric reductase [Calditrichia bacterium]